LFETYPETKRLFGKIDMGKQGKKLLNSLILLVEGLRTPEILVPVLKDLGARHKGYGILSEYYPLMGEVLLDTFGKYLQEDWTPELAQAWLNIYTNVSNIMLEGAGVNVTIEPKQIKTDKTKEINNRQQILEHNSPSIQLQSRQNSRLINIINPLLKIHKIY